jgi:hypothetical protein
MKSRDGYAKACAAMQVRIMKGADDAGKGGPKRPMPDVVEIIPPKDDDYIGEKSLIAKDKEGYQVWHIPRPVCMHAIAHMIDGYPPGMGPSKCSQLSSGDWGAAK